MKHIISLIFIICCSIAASAQNPDPALVKKAQAGDTKAQYSLARFYLPDAESVSEEGLKWLTTAAENGHAFAQRLLKSAYDYGRFGLQNNDEKYVYWLTKLANNNDLENYKIEISYAQFDLGELYEHGERGVRKDISEFLKWEKKAAYNDNQLAAYSLGLHYKLLLSDKIF